MRIRKLLWLIVPIIVALSLSKPARIQYHKWHITAAKREYQRLLEGKHLFKDTLHELLLGHGVTWQEVRARWKRHEQALVDLGYLHRVEYYARRGKVPLIGDPEFARVIGQMDKGCPWRSYTIS